MLAFILIHAILGLRDAPEVDPIVPASIALAPMPEVTPPKDPAEELMNSSQQDIEFVKPVVIPPVTVNSVPVTTIPECKYCNQMIDALTQDPNPHDKSINAADNAIKSALKR
jgi:hypothetical protein